MKLRKALLEQAEACEGLGSPFMGRLLRLLPGIITRDTALGCRLLDWPGEIGPSAASVPLRLCGALHGLVLSGKAPELAQVYPPHAVSDQRLGEAVSAALVDHAGHIDDWLNEAPQTNEVRRSAALIAAGHWLSGHFGLPIRLSELGASGGLNLMWDRFQLEAGRARLGPNNADLTLRPDWTGPLPAPARPRVVERKGVDLNPVDATTPEGHLRLLAYLWPDQPERIARTEAAISVFDGQLAKGDAAAWLDERLARPQPGTLHLVYHTIAFQYFPRASQAQIQAAMEAAGAKATRDTPLAWLSMEADDQHPGAALTLRLWPEGQTLTLGRVDFHGRWLQWEGETS